MTNKISVHLIYQECNCILGKIRNDNTISINTTSITAKLKTIIKKVIINVVPLDISKVLFQNLDVSLDVKYLKNTGYQYSPK